MVKVEWTDFALENLIAIGDYIERDSYFYAQRTVNYLFNSVDILEQHPLAGRIVPEINIDYQHFTKQTPNFTPLNVKLGVLINRIKNCIAGKHRAILAINT